MAKKNKIQDDLDDCRFAPEMQLNLNVRGLRPSATLAINELSRKLEKEGRAVYRLGLGQSPFPVPNTVVEALRQNAYQKDYLPVKGLRELRDAVARHHRRTYGIECEGDDVIVGPGSKELMFLLQLVYYGDIVIPTPAWVSYAPQARIIGRSVVFLHTTPEKGWRVAPEQLDELCAKDPSRPRILVLNYPGNPTGCTYSLSELEALAQVAKKYKMIVLSDEIYGKIHHEGAHRSIAPLYPEGTIFSGGLSKWCGAGGWRLGVFVFPKCLRWLQDAMAVVASETYTSTSAPIQYAAVKAFEENAEIDRYLICCRRILKVLGAEMTGILRKAGVNVLSPEGAFYLFPDFSPLADELERRGIKTSTRLCDSLLEEIGVACLPGVVFGRPEEELAVRMAYVNFDGDKALEAAYELSPGERPDERFMRTYCARPLEAVERVADWLRSL